MPSFFRFPLIFEALCNTEHYAPTWLSQNRCDKCREGLGKLLFQLKCKRSQIRPFKSLGLARQQLQAAPYITTYLSWASTRFLEAIF